MKIPFVTWRNGRPRFNPPESLRKLGHKGHDLKIGDRWMTAGECLDWSNAFAEKLEAGRRAEREAKAAVRAREEKAAARAVAALPKAPRARPFTVGMLLETYLREGTHDLAAATDRLYRQMVKMLEAEAPAFMAAEARAITRPVVVKLYDRLYRTRGVSMSYHGIRVLSIAWNWAIDRDIGGLALYANPAARLKTKAPAPRVRMASVADFLFLVDYADANGYADIADMIVLGAFTGQRTGDRLALTRSTIVDGRLVLTQGKTGRDVVVRLAAPLRARMALRGDNGTDHLVVIAGSRVPAPYSSYAQRWRRLIAAAAKHRPALKGLHDQDLRDTAVSWMTRAGCSQAEIMSVTGHGHAGKHEILGHYQFIDESVSDAAIAKLETWFEAEAEKVKEGEG